MTMDFGKNTAVAVTTVIAGTLMGLGLLVTIGLLLFKEKDTSALLTLVNTMLNAIVYAKLRSVEARTTKIESNTNGTNNRLLDHLLPSPPSDDRSPQPNDR